MASVSSLCYDNMEREKEVMCKVFWLKQHSNGSVQRMQTLLLVMCQGILQLQRGKMSLDLETGRSKLSDIKFT